MLLIDHEDGPPVVWITNRSAFQRKCKVTIDDCGRHRTRLCRPHHNLQRRAWSDVLCIEIEVEACDGSPRQTHQTQVRQRILPGKTRCELTEGQRREMTNRDLLFPQPGGEMMHALSLEIE